MEAFILLAQHDFLLSPRMAMQLIWNRTINTHGYEGKNISADLQMEHLNRQAKDFIAGLGSNITDEAVQQIGKSLRQTVKVLMTSMVSRNHQHFIQSVVTKRTC